MGEIGLKTEPDHCRLQQSETEESDDPSDRLGGNRRGEKAEQSNDAPATDEDGEDGFWGGEGSGQDVDDSKNMEPDQPHEDEPENKYGEGGKRAPGRGACEGHKHDAAGQDLYHMAKRRAADKADENQAQDNANEAGAKSRFWLGHG
jgi:hypothetical protein